MLEQKTNCYSMNLSAGAKVIGNKLKSRTIKKSDFFVKVGLYKFKAGFRYLIDYSSNVNKNLHLNLAHCWCLSNW